MSHFGRNYQQILDNQQYDQKQFNKTALAGQQTIPGMRTRAQQQDQITQTYLADQQRQQAFTQRAQDDSWNQDNGYAVAPRGVGYGADNNYGGGGFFGGGAFGGGGTGQYQSGVTAGRLSNASIGAAQDRLGSYQTPGIPYSPDALQSANDQFGGLVGQGRQAASIDLGRNAAFDQAKLNLRADQTNVDLENRAGNLMTLLQQMNLKNNLRDQSRGNSLYDLVG